MDEQTQPTPTPSDAPTPTSSTLPAVPIAAAVAAPATEVPDADLRVSRVVSQIAAALEGVDLADVRDRDLVEAIVGWEHVISAATARQGEVIRELIARRRSGREVEHVSDEVACALGTTRRAGDLKVGLATSTGRFPALGDALLTGQVDTRKAAIIADHLVGVAHTHASEVLATVLPQAPTSTGPQLRALLRRELIAADPGEAERRATRARADRRVLLEPSNDAMAWISALLPAADATAVFTVLDALATNTDPTADHTRAGSEGRTIDQRRADAFTDVFTTLLDTQTGPTGRPLPRRHGARATVHVTIAASTLLGVDEHPGELTGYGPIPATLARQIAQDATWQRILTDPATGVAIEHGTVRYRPGADLTRTIINRDLTCTFPGCRQPAERCDLDHIIPFTPTRPASEQTTEDNLHAVCRHHHNAKTHTRWTITRNKATGTTTWTSPAGLTHPRNPTPVICTTTHPPSRTTTRPAAPPDNHPPRTEPTGDANHPPPRTPHPDSDPPPF